MSTTTIEAPEPELTEFEAIDVQKVSGVAAGANGFPHLMLKGIPAAEPEPDEDAGKAIVNGKVDQKPDIALGQKILTLLGQAMGNESQEVAAGHHGEAGDVHMLAQAHDIVRQWCNGEKTHPDGIKSVADALKAAADEFALYKRTFTAEQRRKLASEGKALSDGSYPIENAEDLDNAASLARSGHGNVSGAKALIARRAKALGVPNPLDDDDKKAGKAVSIAEDEVIVNDVSQVTEALTKSDLDAAVTKALEAHKAELATLRDELAKVKATPIPGGPVLSANARPQGEPKPGRDDEIAKAERYEALAEQVSDRNIAASYQELARQARQKATQTT